MNLLDATTTRKSSEIVHSPLSNSQWAFLQSAMPLPNSLFRLSANWWMWRGVDDARAANCRQAIAGERTGVVIRGKDMNSELGFAPDLHGILGALVRRVLLDFDRRLESAVR